MTKQNDFAGEKNIYLNNESLLDQGNIKITSYNMSPLMAKTNTVEVPGINGILDISYSLFDYLRFEEREFRIDFVVFEETKDMAMEVIKKINNIILAQKVQFSFARNSTFYTEGRVINSVEYEQEFNGLYYCSITILCYPYATKYYHDAMLWDDIYFPTDYFNTLDYILAMQEKKTISVYFPANFNNELEVYSTLDLGLLTDIESQVSYTLSKGNNKITLLGKGNAGIARKFIIENKSNSTSTVKIAFKTEVLEYV